MKDTRAKSATGFSPASEESRAEMVATKYAKGKWCD